VPSVRLSTVGSRAFSVAAPRIWNALPAETTSAQSLTSFRQHLKTRQHLQTILSRSHHLISPLQTVKLRYSSNTFNLEVAMLHRDL